MKLIIIIGPSGSGKTTLSKLILKSNIKLDKLVNGVYNNRHVLLTGKEKKLNGEAAIVSR